MKTTILFTLSFFLLLNTTSSQITIQCPSDVTVTAIELDEDYTSYGDPIVSAINTFSTTSSFAITGNSCDNAVITINYIATEDSTGNTASCAQQITVTPVTLDVIQWPEEFYSIPSGTLDDLDPEVTLSRPEPHEVFNGGVANIYIAYEDLVLANSANMPYKIIRTWTALSWCTGVTSTFVQILTIEPLLGGALTSLEIPTCGGSTTSSLDINIFTDQSGFVLDLSNCTFANNDLIAYLNCIAENNDIAPESSIILENVNNNDFLNGVSTLDLVIIQRHILGLSPLDETCKLLAADVNNDGVITAIDLITIRKLILGLIPALPSSPSWKVYNVNELDDSAIDVHNIVGGNPQGLIFKKSDFPIQNLELIAIKIGDVNGSSN